MSDIFKDQKIFMEAGDQKPGIDTLNLYHDLIEEEHDELYDAMVQLNVEVGDNEVTVETVREVVDGLVDLIYVAAGALNSLGVDPKIFWDIVQKSNLSKLDPVTGKLIKRSDGKVLKPVGWTPPDEALDEAITKNWDVVGHLLEDNLES